MYDHMRQPRRLTGMVLVALSIAAFFWAASPALLRVAPAGLKCWHLNLSEQPGLYADEDDVLALASLPLSDFVARVTKGRRIEVDGPEWKALFDTVLGSATQWREDLPSAIRHRVADREADHVAALFFRADEPPFAGSDAVPAAGNYFYLYLSGHPETEPLQVMHLPEGATEGAVRGCRWYYRSFTVADAFVHPFRAYAGWLALGGLLVIAWSRLTRLAATLAERPASRRPGVVNRRKRTVRIGLAITLLAGGGVFGMIGWGGHMDLAPPLIFVGGFVFLSGLLVTAGLWRSAIRLDRLIAGDGLIANWTYAPAEWRECVELAVGVETRDKRGVLGLIGVIMLVIGGGFVAIMQDQASLIVVAVLAGIFLLLTFLLVVLPPARRRRLLARPGIALLGRDGAYFAGEIHDFRLFLSRFENAEIGRVGDRLALAVSYSYLSRYGRQYQTAIIPVPRAQEGDAERVAGEIVRQARMD